MAETQDKNKVLYIAIALVGVVIMGIGSFMSCLGSTDAITHAGTIILIISLVITGYGFYKWQP